MPRDTQKLPPGQSPRDSLSGHAPGPERAPVACADPAGQRARPCTLFADPNVNGGVSVCVSRNKSSNDP